jgi:hypothetical protein
MLHDWLTIPQMGMEFGDAIAFGHLGRPENGDIK